MYLYGKCREWVVDRSQNMGPNHEIFLDFLDSRDSGCGLLGDLYHNLFNKLCFGVYKIGNG